jgi:heme exporter protein B
VVPVLLAAVRLTEGALAGEPWAAAAGWWQLLVGFDVVFLVVGLLTFEFVLEA